MNKMKAMARLTIALVLALLAVCVAAETIYTIDINGYSGTSCGGSAAFTTSYSNGTCGSNAQPIAFSTNASCSATGGSTGYFCQGTTICEGDSESCTFVDGATFEWGQEFCMPVTEGVFVGLTCQMEVVPTAPTYVLFFHVITSALAVHPSLYSQDVQAWAWHFSQSRPILSTLSRPLSWQYPTNRILTAISLHSLSASILDIWHCGVRSPVVLGF